MGHDLASRFEQDSTAGYYAWDCITAAWLIDPSLVTASERLPVAVDTTFGPTYGATTLKLPDAGEGRVVTVMLDLDVDRFYGMYETLLTRLPD